MIKTGIYAGVTALLVVMAFLTVPSNEEPEIFNDSNTEFFSEFNDPTQAVALEVVRFNVETSALDIFRVEQKDGTWTIPSHHGYPADAKDRMAEAAGFLIGLKKVDVRSDRVEDHATFGVVNPSEARVATEGCGMLVTFSDSSKGTLASLIIGKKLDSGSELTYVREPKNNRTYTAKLPGTLTTDFESWVEKDLLQVTRTDVDGLIFDNYSIDETNFSRVDGELITAKKDESDWSIDGVLEPDEPNTEALDETVSTLDTLQLVGVRPKPQGLTQELASNGQINPTMQTAMELQARGFFLSRDGGLFSNEGDLHVQTKKGIEYTLKFGEVIYGSGDELTAGTPGKAPGAEDSATSEDGEGSEESKVKDSGGAHRYLMVTARLAEELLEKPEGVPLGDEEIDQRNTARRAMQEIVDAVRKHARSHENTLPENLAALTEGDEPLLKELKKDPWNNDYQLVANPEAEEGVDKFAIVSYAQDGTEGGAGAHTDISSLNWELEDNLKTAAEKHRKYNQQLEDGRKEADKLKRRFSPWYYVISDESFKKLHKDRASLIAKKEPEAGEEEDPTLGPGLPGGSGLEDDGLGGG